MIKHAAGSKQFLCDKHRALALHNPEQSKRLCCKLRAMARDYINQQRWDEAIPVCGTAFETADILLRHDSNSKQATEHYLRSAIELSYTLRKSRHQPDLSAMVDLVRQRLAPLHPPAPLQSLLAPLVDIAFSPLGDVDEWMEMLLAMDDAHRQTRH